MTPRELKDIAASVRQSLLNKARAENSQFDELLRYYAIERFLYRLSKSQYSERFVLKGALMLAVWEAPTTRPTSDIDFLGRIENDINGLETVFREVCSEPVEPDGLVFDSQAVRGETITERLAYPGVRIGMIGRLGRAKAIFHIDVGFGDVVVPPPQKVTYPVILEMPPPLLLTYSRESSISEKAETMVRFGPINSRMKDFYDIWLLSKTTMFQGNVLSEALVRTFDTRGTSVPEDFSGFLRGIAGEASKQAQWQAFLRRGVITDAPSEFDDVVDDLDRFLASPFSALLSRKLFKANWDPGGPWG